MGDGSRDTRSFDDSRSRNLNGGGQRRFSHSSAPEVSRYMPRMLGLCFINNALLLTRFSVTIPHNGNPANIQCLRTIDGNLVKQAMGPLLHPWVITQMAGIHIALLLFGHPIGLTTTNYHQCDHGMRHHLQCTHMDRLLILHTELLMIG
jgi:hypothetical protein